MRLSTHRRKAAVGHAPRGVARDQVTQSDQVTLEPLAGLGRPLRQKAAQVAINMMLQQQAGMAELRYQQEAFHERQQRLQLESVMQVQTRWQQQQDQLQKQQLRNEQQIERRLERQRHGLSENIQALVDRLAQLERLKPQTPEHERGTKYGSQILMPEHSQAQKSSSPKSETLISKVHFEESLEHEKRRMQQVLEERERMLNSQWSNFEQQLKKREEAWKLEREAMATGMQNQMLTVLQAALSQIAPHPATGIQSESPSPPDLATLNPVRAVAAKNSQTPISVAVDRKREIKRETPPVKSATRQESSNASQTQSAVKRTESQVARKTAARKEESAPSSSKRSQLKKQSVPPPDDPDDLEPSDSDNDASRGGDSDSSDAEGFSSEDEDIGMTTTTATADGTTIWNCRPYIGYTNLEKFDEKASRDNRVNWFIKKLRNDQLKTALEDHMFQSITDLERALRRHEDVWREEGYDSSAPKKPRDFRADNVHQGRSQNRGPARRQGRAFMTQGDAEPSPDSAFQHESQNPEVFADQAEAHSKPISESPNGRIDGEVFRVAEIQHWKSPNPHSGQGATRPENWDVFCEKCRKWGHPEVNC
ncbi:hypothetical protein PHMEG_00029069 [Phytophthora megakarya]|uniref:Uncharacterized protein n=1 Tax=Phytophthora megakarya TaxID=4795 RepID=A0A225V1W9_9STRA|nr:hypothetical protein PHMEG_00029069 [Phytophthora megakarya]